MAILKRNRLAVSIYWKNRPILYIYKKNKLVWALITITPSCYAGGSWNDDYAWTDDTPWSD